MIHKLATSVPSIPKNQEISSNNKKWVDWGKNNIYPDFLIEIAKDSAMNKTCIVSKLDGVVGKGLETVNPDQKNLLDKANPKESWNDVFKKISYDYILFNGFAVNVIWSKDGETIAEIYHIDFSKVRSGFINNETQEVEEYFYCSDWKQSRKYKPLVYNAFNKEKSKEFPSQILYHFDYSPGNTFYPIPGYSGGINDIQIDIETSLFHLSNLANGLNPSVFVQMNNGIPSPEERAIIYDEIAGGFGGAENAGKFFLSFSPDKEHNTEVTPIQSVNDQYYLALDTRVSSRILTSHRITSPLLLGIRDGGSGLGSNKEEILVAYEHFMETVIQPIASSILTELNILMDDFSNEDVEVVIIPNRLFEANKTNQTKQL